MNGFGRAYEIYFYFFNCIFNIYFYIYIFIKYAYFILAFYLSPFAIFSEIINHKSYETIDFFYFIHTVSSYNSAQISTAQ